MKNVVLGWIIVQVKHPVQSHNLYQLTTQLTMLLYAFQKLLIMRHALLNSMTNTHMNLEIPLKRITTLTYIPYPIFHQWT